MAAPIKPEIMNAMLGHQNWTMAASVQDLAIKADMRFRVPIKQPQPALCVPVDVQALYVPRGDRERYVRLPMDLGDNDGGKVTEPFSTPTARAGGVHLHWAMPDGLLRGEMVEHADTPVAMPALPNRWLVVRMTGRRGASKLDLKSWLIESETGKTYALGDFPNNPISALEHGLLPAELTGIIGGSPNWTASYDAALNRFAFHDPLDDLDTALVLTKAASYVVIGWWSESRLDPLSSVFMANSVHRKIAGFGWSASPIPNLSTWSSPRAMYQSDPVDTGSGDKLVNMESALMLSTSQASLKIGFSSYRIDSETILKLRHNFETVLHGVVYGVPVTGAIGKDARPAANAINVSMAPTLERLMAAQAAKGLGASTIAKREYFESLMTAVANTSIMDLGSRDGIVNLDEAEHSDGFEAFQGPETYEDVLIERQQSALKAGRPLRTRDARNQSEKPPKAQVMWNGRQRGEQKHTLYTMRQTAAEVQAKGRDASVSDKPLIKRVPRPGPRYHRATAPVIGLRNYGKPQRFLNDGRFNEDNLLVCRWSEELGVNYGDGFKASTFVPLILNANIPDVTNRILQNTFLPDPYMLPWTIAAIIGAAPAATVGATQNRVRGEVALRFSQDGIYDGTAPVVRSHKKTSAMAKAAISDELRRFSIMDGRDVSPVGVNSWVQPWSPVWLEWEVALEPGTAFEGWRLGRIDFDGAAVPNGHKVMMQGRSAITSGLAKSFQSVIDTYLTAENQRDEDDAGEIGDTDAGNLSSLAEFLKNTDLGSVTLDRIDELWLALDNGPDGQVMPAPAAVADALKEAGLPTLVANGTLSLTRARIIDSFGRYNDLNTAQITLPAALEGKTQSGEPALAMPPRLALPARLMWRFVDPSDTSATPREARLDQADPRNTVNPIAGYILPDFMDESLEFFASDGTPLGEVLHDAVTGGLIWEGGVGRNGPVSSSPMDNLPTNARRCGEIAKGMIEADILQRNTPETADDESPLSAFLRAVDTTMWSVDSSLATASATIAGLVGRPIAVVTTRLWLDIPQDLANTGAFTDVGDDIRDHLVREAVFEAVKSTEFKVRLGELAKGHDGLYGFYIGEDFEQFNLIEKEVHSGSRVSGIGAGYRQLLGGIGAELGVNFLPEPSPLNSAYISAGEPLGVHAGQRLRLTLLMHPGARVHATTGFLPRKSLELMRDWVAPGLGRVAPSARIGPVLIDPDKVRLPKIAAFGANQTWTRRNTPLTWRDDPILAATQAAVLPAGRVTVEEGYIRITPDNETEGG